MCAHGAALRAPRPAALRAGGHPAPHSAHTGRPGAARLHGKEEQGCGVFLGILVRGVLSQGVGLPPRAGW